jgi:RimJ/RimL family protein N-acetyltransferase
VTLTLARLDSADRARFDRVRVAPEHEVYCGTAAAAFDHADAAPGRIDLHGIVLDGQPVGLFKIDRDYRNTVAIAGPRALGLRAFMIDRDAQGRGLATTAVRAMAGYLRPLYPDALSVDLTVNHSNAAAIACYLKGGFLDTGLDWPEGQAGPQDLLRLPLSG